MAFNLHLLLRYEACGFLLFLKSFFSSSDRFMTSFCFVFASAFDPFHFRIFECFFRFPLFLRIFVFLFRWWFTAYMEEYQFIFRFFIRFFLNVSYRSCFCEYTGFRFLQNLLLCSCFPPVRTLSCSGWWLHLILF